MTNYRLGEILLKNYFLNQNYKVEDVAQNSDYWHRDIDLKVGHSTIEVKWDSLIHRTNNMFIEYENSCSKGGIGWYRFTQADYIAYGDASRRLYYIFTFESLKNYVESHSLRSVRTTVEESQNGIAYGYLVNINDFMKDNKTMIVKV